MRRRRIAILISGRGSNSATLMAAARSTEFPGEVVLVMSNRPEAEGLARAREAGIATGVVDHTSYNDRESFDEALHAMLEAHAVDVVCLAGFMRVLTDAFVERWAGRMINIHPSLLPLFRGTKTHQRALDAGVLVHGCTVHFVVPELDAGPIIAQAAIPVVPGDTAEALSARVLAQEHLLYPRALQMVCDGSATLVGERVVFAGSWAPTGSMRSPD
ncbi:phosphoribosylglycinamide formyltransferase [Microvirga antarctica]|uniref:phosphoribosylglycinamide formyltransferase n=1 Tax=Microvirga antarctica TaxID=2819233 RepID=UPI001B3102DE|nr:phosphoribosylglycinamide formyltransferase [Microvirga antarctica]